MAERQAVLEEQRRLFYVAITRTTFTLVLSIVATLDGALAYRIGARVRSKGTVVPTVTSQFAEESGPDRADVLPGERLIG